ncbi:AI-2E family transporter [Sphingopyxis bauzanensis]|uniref:AI-2E family transporter n=1 Tax=Sphingopyxis bauzanensis TaxID=651663 RepID=A0A246K089_9SPHN|nr:AI-2E family transporter [Sphingopyxis bauzanensis]OWQ98910.1 AI-2E family transporter [Sphingopyxis bauzanensis]GGJ63332.1 AI-2E family transporter [Sphingopyxis bauzanensis]
MVERVERKERAQARAKATANAPGPTEIRSHLVRTELLKASVWLGLALLIAACIVLIQPILLIFAAIVTAAILDGGTRLLGRVLPIGRGWRLLIVCLSVLLFMIWTAMFAGSQIAAQAVSLQSVVMAQIERLAAWASDQGMGSFQLDTKTISDNFAGTFGRVTAAVGSVVGAFTSLVMILVLGVFIAIEPRLYERGVAWMLPMKNRENFYITTARMGFTLRRLMAGRLLGMFVEGVGTWLACMAVGIPMAALLGLLTGLLAFIPNIGAIVSGVLLVLVGFSAGTDAGLWAIAIYLVVQTVDGYLIVPMVAKKTVDLAPALVLGAQILFGALLGIMGLFLADPIVAMIKVALEREAERNAGAAPKVGKAAAG